MQVKILPGIFFSQLATGRNRLMGRDLSACNIKKFKATLKLAGPTTFVSSAANAYHSLQEIPKVHLFKTLGKCADWYEALTTVAKLTVHRICNEIRGFRQVCRPGRRRYSRSKTMMERHSRKEENRLGELLLQKER